MERKEAIEVIKKNWPDSSFTMLREALETLVPELKESEDERISKALVKYFTSSITNPDYEICGVPFKEVVAWLKKQGEKVSAIEGFETEFERQVSGLIASAVNKEHEHNEGYVKWTANALLNYAKHELKKQGEQKQPKELTNSEFVEKCKGLSRLEQHILSLVPTRPIDAIKVDARTIRYLVEQEQGEQNPVEWSEEDEDNILHICCWLNEYGNFLLGKSEDKSNRIFKTVDWLKSIKDRYTWKPSDEQMNTLEYYMHTLVCNEHKEILFGLYSCLKKLREE